MYTFLRNDVTIFTLKFFYVKPGHLNVFIAISLYISLNICVPKLNFGSFEDFESRYQRQI